MFYMVAWTLLVEVLCRPLNSYGLTVRFTVSRLFSRSHGQMLISHCHSGHFNLILCFLGPTDLFNSLEES